MDGPASLVGRLDQRLVNGTETADESAPVPVRIDQGGKSHTLVRRRDLLECETSFAQFRDVLVQIVNGQVELR